MLLRKNPSEKNRDVFSPDDKLPTARTEAKALFRMVGRNGNGLDSLESMRELIQVQDEVKKEMFKHAPDEEEVKRILRFRERVLVVFDELAAKQEKKRLRHSRFLAKRIVPTDTNLNTIVP